MMITFQQYLERDEAPESQSISQNIDTFKHNSEDETALLHNLQRASYELVINFGPEMKRLIRNVVASGKLDEQPEFKESLEKLVELIASSKMRDAARKAADSMNFPITQDKEENDFDNTVTPSSADRSGGSGDGGGD
jgi:hypothetical protein